MTAFRSFAFNGAFYGNLIAFMVLGAPFYLTPRPWSIWALKVWARVSLKLLAWIGGIGVEIRHAEHLPEGPFLVACKHQSVFETFALLPLFCDPAMVVKSELTWIPLFGWFALKFGMISIDREAGPTALRRMLGQARRARDMGRQIVVFPEGTRMPPGARPDYKPGVAALYANLGLPCVPIALNSGLFWPRRAGLRAPGTITIDILEPIAPGLERKRFMAVLKQDIEQATKALERQAHDAYPHLGTAREQHKP